jgi:hypothetical protein
MRLCSIPSCPRRSDARGWCKTHYKRWQRRGDPMTAPATSHEKQFDDGQLDELHRSSPDREFSLDEIAKALGTNRQTVWAIERRALAKMRNEFLKRGVYF